MVAKLRRPDRTKFVLGTRGPYVVAALPGRTGKFIAEQLVAAVRITRPTATLTAIAGEHGESERNFRRYMRGMPMPLGKARRFAGRLRTLHLDTVNTLENIAPMHPRADQVTPLLTRARRALETGYETLDRALEEQENIVRLQRTALLIRRTQPYTDAHAQTSMHASARYQNLERSLDNIEKLIRAGAEDAL